VKNFGLFHHNQERTDRQVDAIVAECNKIIKHKKLKMKCFAVAERQVVRL